MTIYIKDVNNRWVEGTPTEEGQLFKDVMDNGGILESSYSVPVIPTEVKVSDITGGIKFSAETNTVSVYAGDTLTLSGTIDIDDTILEMGVSKNGYVDEIMIVSVSEGLFEGKVNFDTSGQYTLSKTDTNINVDDDTYTIDTITFNVIKKL